MFAKKKKRGKERDKPSIHTTLVPTHTHTQHNVWGWGKSGEKAASLTSCACAYLCVLISCMVQKATSSHLVLLLTATGNYQCFILTGFDVLKQGCSRTTVSKAQHWASSNSSVSSELSVLNQLSHLFIWLELVPPKKKKRKKKKRKSYPCPPHPASLSGKRALI